jgi:hypothetical protein
MVDVGAYFPQSTLVEKLGRQATVQELADHIAKMRFLEADAMIAAGKGGAS